MSLVVELQMEEVIKKIILH